MLSVKEGHLITISSDPDIIKAVKTESLDSDFAWSHNGVFLYTGGDRIAIEANDIGKAIPHRMD